MKSLDASQDPTESLAPAADFWSFIDLAIHRLGEEFEEVDIESTRVLLTLNRASDLVTYDLESSIHRPSGWSWSGFRLMFVIWLAGPMEASRAARLSNMSRAAVSNLTTTLGNKGLLRRKADPDDGRAITLFLSVRGREEVRAIFSRQNLRESEWVTALTEVERDLLVALLEKLITHRQSISGRIRE